MKTAVTFSALTVATLSALLLLRLHTASPSEWLLVVRDGRSVSAGVGMSHLAMPGEQVVKFPSSLQKFAFTAQQVTSEMQGVEVKGFAIWGVYREGDGPFNAYKYLDGMSDAGREKASTNLANMAESILRSQVADMTIADVLTKRKGLREQLTLEMMEVVKGWGIWLETVEVTDVRILSSSLFNNLQTKFREESRQTAEQQQLAVQQQIALTRLQNKLEVDKESLSVQREVAVHELQQKVAEHEEKVAAEARQHNLTLQRQAIDHELAMQTLRQHAELRAAQLEEELKVQLQRAEAAEKIEQLRLRREQGMQAVNLENAKMRMLKDIYAALPLHDFKVVNMAGGGANSTMGGGLLLPGLAALMGAGTDAM